MPALPSRGSALTEEVRQEDWHEDGFRIGSATAFPRGLCGTPAAMSMLRDCDKSLLPDSRPSRWKTTCGSSLLCPNAASALVLEVLLEKGILQSTFTIVRAALIASCVGSPAVFPRELGGTPAAIAHFSN